MTTLNDFNKVNGTTRVMAEHVNDLLSATFRSEYKNVETLSGTRTLLDVDTPIQRLDCDGANRIVAMPTGDAVENHPYLLINASDGGEQITVKSNDETETLATLAEGASVLLLPDGAGLYKVFSGGGGRGGELMNYLINGGFPFAQRQAPATLTTYAANTYSADRWKTYAENASYQYQRQDGLGETGLTSQYFGAFKKITSDGKLFIFQIAEGVNSVPLRGKTVIFQCQMKASSAKTIRMGIFELATAGTIDAVPATIVTAAGANSTDPTMGTNVAIITAAQSKSVTTSMQTFSVSVTVPATSKNIICAVWTDSQFAVNDILYIAEAGLYVSSEVQAWTPRPVQQELSLCNRYYRKSYALETAPATVNAPNYLFVVAYTTARLWLNVFYEVEMRTTPTFSVISLAGTTSKASLEAGGADVGTSVTVNVGAAKILSLVSDSGSGFTVGVAYLFHYTASAEL